MRWSKSIGICWLWRVSCCRRWTPAGQITLATVCLLGSFAGASEAAQVTPGQTLPQGLPYCCCLKPLDWHWKTHFYPSWSLQNHHPMGRAASGGKKAGDDFWIILWQVIYCIFGIGHTEGSYVYLEQKYHLNRSVEREGSVCRAKTNCCAAGHWCKTYGKIISSDQHPRATRVNIVG